MNPIQTTIYHSPDLSQPGQLVLTKHASLPYPRFTPIVEPGLWRSENPELLESKYLQYIICVDPRVEKEEALIRFARKLQVDQALLDDGWVINLIEDPVGDYSIAFKPIDAEHSFLGIVREVYRTPYGGLFSSLQPYDIQVVPDLSKSGKTCTRSVRVEWKDLFRVLLA